jgi:3-hydroxy-9,10-secoandrosta-1,3,5(10)-triene-9,17-dione monooxygenase
MTEGAGLREAVKRLVPTIRGRVAAAEEARSVPAESIAELRSAGLFRAFVPRKFGGDERGLSEVMESVIELAQGCSSTAWVGSLLTVHGLAIAWFDERAQSEVWKDGPDALVVSSSRLPAPSRARMAVTA